MFQDGKVDPFEYIYDELRQKHDNANYNIDDSCNATVYSNLSRLNLVLQQVPLLVLLVVLIFLVFLDKEKYKGIYSNVKPFFIIRI